LRCLDPKDGAVIWERNIGEIAQRQPPMWGFSSSPLAVGARIIVHAGGAGDKSTLAFDAATGELRWSAPGGDDSYSSPQLATFGGEEFVLMLSNLGLDFLEPATGAVRFAYGWKHSDHRALQPQVASADTVLIPTGMGAGTRLIRLTRNGSALNAEEVWTSRFLKPDFNDFVISEGHAYGFDSNIFTCINLATGERAWKGGRYGKGQVLLLADSGLLFVMGERGEGVLLRATPKAHEELANLPLLNGKTWNHPAIVGDRLFVRNAEEAACYRLPRE
jgi:outer membrane protein assembly factor BamB